MICQVNSLWVILFLNELLELIFLHTDNGFKYSYPTLIILFNINHLLQKVKWLQVLLFNISNSIYQVLQCNN